MTSHYRAVVHTVRTLNLKCRCDLFLYQCVHIEMHWLFRLNPLHVWDIFSLDAIIRSWESNVESRENKRQLHASANKVNESYCDVLQTERDLSLSLYNTGNLEREKARGGGGGGGICFSPFFYLFQELIV